MNRAMRNLALLALVAMVIFALALTAGAQATQNGITSPKDGATVRGTVDVVGEANDANFMKWQLDLLPNGNANAATFLALGTNPGAVTHSLDTTRYPEGAHALRLRVVRNDSNYDEYTTRFVIANTVAPTKAAAPAPAAPAPAARAPAARAASAAAEANKALVRRYVAQVLNAGRPEAVDQFVAPNYKRYPSATAAPLNAEGQKQRLAGIFAAFPGMQFTIDDIVAEGDRVAYRLTARGTQKGPFQGIAPTGQQVTVAALEIARIENGKYVEHWGGPDTLDWLQQLGAVVSAGPVK